MTNDMPRPYFYLVSNPVRARKNGQQAFKRGNLALAWQWFRRHDDLRLLALMERR